MKDENMVDLEKIDCPNCFSDEVESTRSHDDLFVCLCCKKAFTLDEVYDTEIEKLRKTDLVMEALKALNDYLEDFDLGIPSLEYARECLQRLNAKPMVEYTPHEVNLIFCAMELFKTHWAGFDDDLTLASDIIRKKASIILGEFPLDFIRRQTRMDQVDFWKNHIEEWGVSMVHSTDRESEKILKGLQYHRKHNDIAPSGHEYQVAVTYKIDEALEAIEEESFKLQELTNELDTLKHCITYPIAPNVSLGGHILLISSILKDLGFVPEKK